MTRTEQDELSDEIESIERMIRVHGNMPRALEIIRSLRNMLNSWGRLYGVRAHDHSLAMQYLYELKTIVLEIHEDLRS